MGDAAFGGQLAEPDPRSLAVVRSFALDHSDRGPDPIFEEVDEVVGIEHTSRIPQKAVPISDSEAPQVFVHEGVALAGRQLGHPAREIPDEQN
jgi:hypothetical protein